MHYKCFHNPSLNRNVEGRSAFCWQGALPLMFDLFWHFPLLQVNWGMTGYNKCSRWRILQVFKLLFPPVMIRSTEIYIIN